MFPYPFTESPNKDGLLQQALYLAGGCHLEDKAVFYLRACPSPLLMGNGTSQGVNGNTKRPGALALHFSTPSARAAGRLPLAQMPHAANTWLRLQCGARAPEGGWRALGAGRPLEVFQTAGRRGGNSALPGQNTRGRRGRGPRPCRFLESSACRGARPERRGRGRGAAATRWAPAAPRGRRAVAALPIARG